MWLRHDEGASAAGLYLGLAAPHRAAVDTTYAAAIAAGATGERAPGVRSYFGPTYYAANITDPDHNRLEIVFKG